MTFPICVDASFIVALLVPEQFSQVALSFWEEWVQESHEVVAPSLLQFEVTSALYRKTLRGPLAWEDFHLVLQQFLDLDINWTDLPILCIRAAELAHLFQRPNTYDAFYLALAEHLDCPLWTADERFYNAVRSKYRFIHFLGKSST